MWETLTSNYIINAGVLSWTTAQILKTIIAYFFTKRVNLERLVGAGGMPSSHSALTTSVAVAMFRKMGYASPEFAIAAMFAVIVMYDAMGVRRAAGEQAKVLNRLIFEFTDWPIFAQRNNKTEQYVEAPVEPEESEEADSDCLPKKELKEFLGHTPLEVLGGLILGIIIAVLLPVK